MLFKNKDQKNMRNLFKLCIVSLLFVVLACSGETKTPSGKYVIDHYADTIFGQVILTTVCHNEDNSAISSSTLSLGRAELTE